MHWSQWICGHCENKQPFSQPWAEHLLNCSELPSKSPGKVVEINVSLTGSGCSFCDHFQQDAGILAAGKGARHPLPYLSLQVTSRSSPGIENSWGRMQSCIKSKGPLNPSTDGLSPTTIANTVDDAAANSSDPISSSADRAKLPVKLANDDLNPTQLAVGEQKTIPDIEHVTIPDLRLVPGRLIQHIGRHHERVCSIRDTNCRA